MRHFLTLPLGLSLLALAACSDDSKPAVGDFCSTQDDCEQGICVANQCVDPDDDNDGDGLTNALENSFGSNPFSNDSDDDGILDQFEVSPQATLVDTDGDGKPDILESAIRDHDNDCVPDQFDPEDNDPSVKGELVDCSPRDFVMVESTLTLHIHTSVSQLAYGNSIGRDIQITMSGQAKAAVKLGQECDHSTRFSFAHSGGQDILFHESGCIDSSDEAPVSADAYRGSLIIPAADDRGSDDRHEWHFSSEPMWLYETSSIGRKLSPEYAEVLYGGRTNTARTTPLNEPNNVTNELGGSLYFFIARSDIQAEALQGNWAYVSLSTQASASGGVTLSLTSDAHTFEGTSLELPNFGSNTHTLNQYAQEFTFNEGAQDRPGSLLSFTEPGVLTNEDGSLQAVVSPKANFMVLHRSEPGMHQLTDNQPSISEDVDNFFHEFALWVRHTPPNLEDLAGQSYMVTRQEALLTEAGVGIGLTTGILTFEPDTSGLATYTDQGRIVLGDYSGRFEDESYPSESKSFDVTLGENGRLLFSSGEEHVDIEGWTQANGGALLLAFSLRDQEGDSLYTGSMSIAMGHCITCR